MTGRPDAMRGLREQAWAFGRDLRNSLLRDYQRQYDVEVPPPPALIIDELLTDFLHVRLQYVPLAGNVFAKVEWIDGVAVVKVNSLTASMPKVKHARGVENVGKCHETMHVVRDLPTIRAEGQGLLPGFGAPSLVCCRATNQAFTSRDIGREFWAEEAGRAFAVSMPALAHSHAFRELLTVAGLTDGAIPEAWPLLFQAADDIAVNISALVRQLTLEGLITLDGPEGHARVHVQPTLLDLMEQVG